MQGRVKVVFVQHNSRQHFETGQIGEEIEIRPGIVTKDRKGQMQSTPIFSRIVSLFAESNPLQYAVPGGIELAHISCMLVFH